MHFLVFMDELLTVQFVLGCVIRIDEWTARKRARLPASADGKVVWLGEPARQTGV
jgi:hypothetical protein